MTEIELPKLERRRRERRPADPLVGQAPVAPYAPQDVPPLDSITRASFFWDEV
ncbi:MAG: hypothetical protein KatS3mg077_2854 [Candidatus Binatia bacterium]|nr:MAG: hypothetical protein KatS3mg077_2854 [Candidatus Binatia bacterium]